MGNLIDFDFKGKNKILYNLNKLYATSKLNKQKFDLFHPTYYDDYFINNLKSKPFVLTIHDMTHEKFANIISNHDHTIERKKILAEKAKLIIAISESTKKDIIDILNISSEKIDVVYHGNPFLPFTNNVNNEFFIKNYILFVGNRSHYKNFNNMVKSIYSLIIKYDLKLICLGGGPFNKEENKLLNQYKVSNRVIQYFAQENEIANFYKNAELFIFPSLYEGFGFPILEAFSNNCPVACSNTSSFPEVAGNGALYFDPNSCDEIFNTVEKILISSELKNKLKINGQKQLQLFNWKITSDKTLNVYKKAIS